MILLAIGVFLTVGNGYHRLLGKQFSTILSQSTGVDALPDKRGVIPVKYLAAFGFYFVCVPLQKHLRILFYGRYSKEEQRQQSIEDQLLYCKEFLSEMEVDVSSIDQLSDRGVSGEIHSRPGIDQVRQGIMQRKWDLIICEDSSRLYRGISPCMNLFSPAVDNDIRLICINDKVDTANDDWPQRLEEAQRHHGQDNYYTRFRIKRTHDGRWVMGAAMGSLRPGYERYLRNPEQYKDPKFDRIDQQWVEAIRTAFQMVADGLPLDEVGVYLTEQGLPKNSNAQIEEWSDKNVLKLIRCPIYRGEEKFREKISRKMHTTGKSKPIRNPDPKKILTRSMPHLRIVEDWLWHQANRAIDQRIKCKKPVSGIDHPLYGIPRHSRSPLSNLFVCGICGRKMYVEGRREGAFRCSAVKHDQCWNRATVLRKFTYHQIGASVSSAILESSDEILNPLLTYIEKLQSTPADTDELRAQLKKRRKDLEREQHKWFKVISKSDQSLEFITERAEAIQAELEDLKADEQQLEYQLSQTRSLPPRDEITAKLREAAEQILAMEGSSRSVLERLLDGPIRAIPCQQVGSNKVVLRAEFTLQLAQFGLQDVGRLLCGNQAIPVESELFRKQLVVDLFEPSQAPKHAIAALEFYERDPNHYPTLVQIGDYLGISKRAAHLALLLGKQLQEKNITDPFIPLTEAPENASRWRPKQSA